MQRNLVIAKAEMVFITNLLVIMRYFAVLPDERIKCARIHKFILFVVCSLPMMFVLIPSILYLILFFDSINMLDLTDFIHTILIYGCNWSSYMIIAFNQICFRNLIGELKSMVAKSVYLNVKRNFGAIQIYFIFSRRTDCV